MDKRWKEYDRSEIRKSQLSQQQTPEKGYLRAVLGESGGNSVEFNEVQLNAVVFS